VQVYIVGDTIGQAGPWLAEVKVLPRRARKRGLRWLVTGWRVSSESSSGRDSAAEAQAQVHDRR
jgi:hypothetical protein